ncbi:MULTISPECIES: hypothetical protein [unclassified Variovorax]|uniref:hypothetical protein n=1 Tax=unclassified Variovorax TaxID=663243 RepID=UPI001317E0B3|nr:MULTISPECIES: hypothetical protein [unclassified Variovorax]VTU42765.1 hypothetical protein H6P1_00273 [Variovorax sp. PBL-H6]VTU43697.1 hypothetical protein SRS16P1_00631 [Variovorax sp. SRS16]VTU43762.1 hypothetical protein E5P1_00625 [Variovorax sp. PBL-E5]
MDGYTNFTIQERNGYPHYAGPQFLITASACEATPLVGHRLRSLDEARREVRGRIINRIHRAEQLLAGWKRQLTEVETTYQPVRTLLETLAAFRDDIVGHLTEFRESSVGGLFKFGQLSISCGYMNTPNLIVFQLAEYDNITLLFLPQDLLALNQLLKDAGFSLPYTDWNGEHCNSYSVKLCPADFLVNQVPAAA